MTPREAALAAIMRAAKEAQVREAEQHAAYLRAKLIEMAPPSMTSGFPYLPPNHPVDTPTVPWVMTDADRVLLDKFRLSGE